MPKIELIKFKKVKENKLNRYIKVKIKITTNNIFNEIMNNDFE